MKEEAIQTFKLISRIEFELGFISLRDYYLRLVTLFHLTDKSDNIKNYIFEVLGEADFLESEYVHENDSNNTVEHIEEGRNDKGDGNDNNEDETLHYLTPKSGKFSKWDFIIGDPDFFPSIPHGHSTKNRKIKLDSYLGYYYDTTNKNNKSNSIGREKRQYIIELWNDDKFRIFAIDHIDWYLQRFPNYNWRVPKHRIGIIPKKR